MFMTIIREWNLISADKSNLEKSLNLIKDDFFF